MKRIVSVSIGASSRNHRVTMNICGQDFIIERIGTDGNIGKAISLIKELDGKVDVFGMGGIDLYLYGRNGRKYIIRAALPIARAAIKTPIVDGSGLKNTLERNVINFISQQCNIYLNQKKVLLVSGMDRFGMAEAFTDMGCSMIFGDIIFALGLPIPIHSLKNLHRLAAVLMPVISRMPFEFLYPTGKKQEEVMSRYSRYYHMADIIAGDFLYIKRYLPDDLNGKIIVTNTVTLQDVQLLKERGVKLLVTSTPEFNGRSFGTNVIEALIVSLSGKRPEDITPDMYTDMIREFGIKHRVEYLN
ncbi:MAG: quinate 5-dehydrogenase [Clostridiales bacterium]|mgnify:FL=1|jgi:hypothetical protein|nr:quinate 5-dehydrogenase [Clostridiales bacterium]